jgi:hypothetical protein
MNQPKSKTSLWSQIIILMPRGEKIDNILTHTAIYIVIMCFLFMISGCTYYKYSTTVNSQPDIFVQTITDEIYEENKFPRDQYTDETLEKMLFTDRDFYVFNSDGRWHLSDLGISGDTITALAMISPIPEGDPKAHPETRSNKKYISDKEGYILKRINLHVGDLKIQNGEKVKIPVSSISYFEVYQKDRSKTAGRAIGTFFIIIGAGCTLLILIAIIATITNPPDSSSCPFVYVIDGNDWEFAGEIYGGAVYPSLERVDYLSLPQSIYQPGSTYRVKLSNKLQEVQYINHTGLLILAHDSTIYPVPDKYGNIQTLSDPVLPIAASDSKGLDCLAEVSVKDKITHDFDEELDTSSTSNYLNRLELTFNSNSNPGSAKLFINGKNSLWGDRMVREFYNLFGNRYQKFVGKMEDKPASYHQEWMMQQGLLLQVYIMKNGEWQKTDYFNMVGAFGSRDMVLPLDLDDAWSTGYSDSTYTLRIKLESGFNFWELDYASIDLTANAEVEKTRLSPVTAEDQNGKNVLKLLVSDDDRYLIQKTTGEEVTLDFKIPASVHPSNTIFLESKGYYQQSGMQSNEPDLIFLETFREPGRLSQWSSQRYSEEKNAFQNLLGNKSPDEQD